MKNLLGFILFAGVTGCSWEPQPLHLSPELPAHIQVSFIEAAAEWNLAQNVYWLRVTREPDANGFYNVNSGDLPGVAVGETGIISGIVIDPEVPVVISWLTAAHELGHWLGTSEHTSGGVMRPGYEGGEYAKCIDAESAAFLGGEGTCNKKEER